MSKFPTIVFEMKDDFYLEEFSKKVCPVFNDFCQALLVSRPKVLNSEAKEEISEVEDIRKASEELSKHDTKRMNVIRSKFIGDFGPNDELVAEFIIKLCKMITRKISRNNKLENPEDFTNDLVKIHANLINLVAKDIRKRMENVSKALFSKY